MCVCGGGGRWEERGKKEGETKYFDVQLSSDLMTSLIKSL